LRAPDDYVARMIELAGGRYCFGAGEPAGGKSSVSVTMEAFYAAARDADYLIYNATIDDPLPDLAALLEKSPLLADFRAVREGNAWCTDKTLYQATGSVGEFTRDLHRMLTGETEGLRFIYRLE